MYEERSYRSLFKGQDMIFFDACVYETDLCIGAHTMLQTEALDAVKRYRMQLETYIRLHPAFLTSLTPLAPLPGAPPMVTHMCEAAKKAGVGPMAAVAGAFSELVGKELLAYSDEVIVENGGDIFIRTRTVRKVGIFAGDSPLSGKLSIEVSPAISPMGVCTSSGTVGHSLSFGKADAALVISRDTFLADAVATAMGNRVQTSGDIENALAYAYGIDGIEGALVIIGDKLGAIGDVKISK